MVAVDWSEAALDDVDDGKDEVKYEEKEALVVSLSAEACTTSNSLGVGVAGVLVTEDGSAVDDSAAVFE